MISYSQLRKSKISFKKKFQTIAIYLFPTFYLKKQVQYPLFISNLLSVELILTFTKQRRANSRQPET